MTQCPWRSNIVSCEPMMLSGHRVMSYIYIYIYTYIYIHIYTYVYIYKMDIVSDMPWHPHITQCRWTWHIVSCGEIVSSAHHVMSYVYTYVHIYIYVYIYIYIYIYIYVYIYWTLYLTWHDVLALHNIRGHDTRVEWAHHLIWTSCHDIHIYICTYIYIYIHTYVYIYWTLYLTWHDVFTLHNVRGHHIYCHVSPWCYLDIVSCHIYIYIYIYKHIYICVTWLIHMRGMTDTCVACLIHMCDMIHPYACHAEFMCVTCRIHMRDTPHLWYMHYLTHLECANLCHELIYMCDMTHTHV